MPVKSNLQWKVGLTHIQYQGVTLPLPFALVLAFHLVLGKFHIQWKDGNLGRYGPTPKYAQCTVFSDVFASHTNLSMGHLPVSQSIGYVSYLNLGASHTMDSTLAT